MIEGDVLLAKLPQDISEKLRPVLFLRRMPLYNDLLICAISTQLYQYINEFDLLLDFNSPGFSNSGLIRPSIIKLSSLAVVPQHSIAGSIGKIPTLNLLQLKNNLANYITEINPEH